MKKIRSILYFVAKMLGDVNAIQKNKVGRRIGQRLAGKVTGNFLSKLFK